MRRATISAFALAALFGASAVIGQEETAGSGSGILTGEQFDRAIRADEAIGATVYTMNEAYDENVWLENRYWENIDDDWDAIGEVEDIIISRDGRVIGLVVEVGGWLDIGDENYVVDLQDLRVVGEEDGDVDFATRLSQAQMEQMPRAPSESWF